MIIRFDYDNDQIILSPNNLISDQNKNCVTFKRVPGLKMHQEVVTEIINMICDGNDHPSITIEKQDEGEITGIEEY